MLVIGGHYGTNTSQYSDRSWQRCRKWLLSKQERVLLIGEFQRQSIEIMTRSWKFWVEFCRVWLKIKLVLRGIWLLEVGIVSACGPFRSWAQRDIERLSLIVLTNALLEHLLEFPRLSATHKLCPCCADEVFHMCTM